MFGANNTVNNASNSTVIGSNNRNIGASGLVDSVVIGLSNDLTSGGNNKQLFILGSNITSVTSNSVFLGDRSNYIDKAVSPDVTAGVGMYNANYTVGSVDYMNDFAQQDAVGVVAVGNRRVQGVAAGLVSKDSTDAINGSQLYRAYENLQWRVSVSSADSGAAPVVISTDARQVIGSYDKSPNKGNLDLVAGKGIRIKAESGDALKLTFEAMGGARYSGDYGVVVSPSEDARVVVKGNATPKPV